MAPTEPTIVRLDTTALDGCRRLSEEAGWNQSAEDWRLFFDQGSVFGHTGPGGLQATGAVLPYAGFAWISMVLVAKAARGRGLGTGILKHCVAELERRDLLPVLDATPQGERIYAPLGFLPQFLLWRWRSAARPVAAAPDPIAATAAGPGDLDRLAAIDTPVFGAPRRSLIASLMARAPSHALMSANGRGFVLARPGRTALQIGPLVAADAAEAGRLLMAALARAQGPVIIDVPEHAAEIGELLAEAGFIQERPYLRMALGRREPSGDPGRLFAIAGPELG